MKRMGQADRFLSFGLVACLLCGAVASCSGEDAPGTTGPRVDLGGGGEPVADSGQVEDGSPYGGSSTDSSSGMAELGPDDTGDGPADALPDDAPRADAGGHPLTDASSPDAAIADAGSGGNVADATDGEADPDGGPAAPEAAVLWFLHVADTHVGEPAEAVPRLAVFLDQVLPVVEPVATLHAGDLVDLGSSAEQWSAYREIIDGRVAPFPGYLEVPGNHDLKEGGTGAYLTHSWSGLAREWLHGVVRLETPAGTVLVVRTNTADTTLNPANVLGYFGEDQANELLALLDAAPPSLLTIVLGHHPTSWLDPQLLRGSGRRMQQVIEHAAAEVYLCGHVHIPYLSWIGGTLSVQTGSLGKQSLGSPSFALLAWDGGNLSSKVVPFDAGAPAPVSWPLVLITRPVNAALGGINPLARPIGPAEVITVQALVFAPAAVDLVEASIDGGAAFPLQPGGAHRWRGEVAAPVGDGLHQLEVRARMGEASSSDLVLFTVAPPAP